MKLSIFFFRPLIILLVFYTDSKTVTAVIYNLNETEYEKLPPVFHLDPYAECMRNPEGLYCMTEAVLVSDEESHLLNVIQEFSAHTSTHYNHSLIRYNLCVTDTCKEHYNTTRDLREDLEACLNQTFYERYKLKTKVLDNIHCKKADEKTPVEVADVCVFALFVGILTLNVVGSIYDFYFTNGENGGIRFLTYFAIRRNWRKLVAPACDGPDWRLKRVEGLSSLKCATTILVVMVHALFPSLYFVSNTKYAEDAYSNFGVQMLINGTVVVQTFFLVSGFLLTFHLELMSERMPLNWLMFPKGVVMRWMRLTPMYAVVLFFSMTCTKYLADGPYWHIAIMSEVEDCKQHWWQHLLYINNYSDGSVCMMHSWYLATEMQLSCLGLAVYLCCRSPGSRKVVLPLLMVVAIIIPVAHTYFQDLDGVLVFSPEAAVTMLLNNKTFNYIYRRTHTNLLSYLAGAAAGLLAYRGLHLRYDVQRLRKYRILYYALTPIGIAMLFSGRIFFHDGPRPSLAVRLLFTAYQKPVWCLLIGIGILGGILKYENIMRGVAEWSGWRVPSRVSYCVYLLHVTLVRLAMASRVRLARFAALDLIEHVTCIVVLSYLLAVPCWLLVEQPFRQVMKLLVPEKSSPDRVTVTVEDIKKEDKKLTFHEQITHV